MLVFLANLESNHLIKKLLFRAEGLAEDVSRLLLSDRLRIRPASLGKRSDSACFCSDPECECRLAGAGNGGHWRGVTKFVVRIDVQEVLYRLLTKVSKHGH